MSLGCVSQGTFLGEGAMSCCLIPTPHPGNFPLELGSGHLLILYLQGVGGGKPCGAAVGGKGLQMLSSLEKRR